LEPGGVLRESLSHLEISTAWQVVLPSVREIFNMRGAPLDSSFACKKVKYKRKIRLAKTDTTREESVPTPNKARKYYALNKVFISWKIHIELSSEKYGAFTAKHPPSTVCTVNALVRQRVSA
jgi:hypothetical protein